LRYAAARHAALKTPVRYVPGNHDVGDNPRAEGEASEAGVSSERIAQFRQLFGADYWSLTAPGWQIFGLNALVFNSATSAEDEQFAWLEQALAGGTGALGVVLHKPLLPHEDPAAPPVR
jgi:3',5'-cyclic AMP phosphodiesterase CpdA